MQLISIKIDHTKRKRIFALARSAGLSSEQLHEKLPEWCGYHSLKDMSIHQADQVIHHLTHDFPASGGRGKGKRTKGQFGMIKGKQKELRWSNYQLEGFMQHTAGNDDINDLTVPEATKIINGLKQMLLSKTHDFNRGKLLPSKKGKLIHK